MARNSRSNLVDSHVHKGHLYVRQLGGLVISTSWSIVSATFLHLWTTTGSNIANPRGVYTSTCHFRMVQKRTTWAVSRACRSDRVEHLAGDFCGLLRIFPFINGAASLLTQIMHQAVDHVVGYLLRSYPELQIRTFFDGSRT